MLYLYKDVTVRWNTQELLTGLTVKIPLYYGDVDIYEKYKNYSQSNVYQVGSWYNESGGQMIQMNENWSNLMKEVGISTKLLNVILLSTYSYAPSQAKKDAFQITLGSNISTHLYNAMEHTGNHSYNYIYNSAQYNTSSCVVYGQLSNFRGEFHIPVFDVPRQKWFILGWEYRTDNFNQDKIWLVVGSPDTYYFFPTRNIPIFNPSDPGSYVPDSPSEPTGGQEDEPPTSGLVDLPAQPEVSALGSGMMKLYNPSKAQIIELGAWLWNSGLNLDSLKKIFSTPMDVILGLHIVPVSPPTDPAENVIFGNIDSGIQMRPVTSQYMTKNMGSLKIPEYYNSYLDYEPYTQIELYLPYIGSRTLSPDEVMNKTLTIDYRVDVLSGACVALVSVNGNLLYQYGGTCASQIPITSQNYQGVIQGVLGAVGSVVSGIIGIGAIAGGLVAAPATAGGSLLAGGAVGATALASSAKNVMSAKQRIEHSGGITASTGIIGGQKPYVIITRPNWCKPANQPHFTGYPGFFYAKVSQLSGYTQFVNFEVTNVHATDEELEEIKDWFINKGVRI